MERTCIAKIPKWPSLKSLALKSKFICPFEFLENLEYVYGKFNWRARPCSPVTFFCTNILSLFSKIKTVRKFHSLMSGTSNLAILMLSTCFYDNFMKSRSHGGLAAKGLLAGSASANHNQPIFPVQ